MDIRSVTVRLYSDLRWRYDCSACRRVAGVFYTQAMAQRDADTHLCEAPRHHEKTAAERAAAGAPPVAV